MQDVQPSCNGAILSCMRHKVLAGFDFKFFLCHTKLLQDVTLVTGSAGKVCCGCTGSIFLLRSTHAKI